MDNICQIRNDADSSQLYCPQNNLTGTFVHDVLLDVGDAAINQNKKWLLDCVTGPESRVEGGWRQFLPSSQHS